MNELQAEKYYDQLAVKYDQATANSWAAPMQIESITTNVSNKETSVLDIGIGTGQSIHGLYNSQNFKLIEGIDVSEEMIKYCKESYPDVILHKGDFLQFNNFQLSQYDLIICCGTLEFINNLESFLKKCSSLLAKNGNLVITFEPRIDGHSVQGKSISEVKSERLIGVEGFMTYRHDLDYFKITAEKSGLQIKKQSLFVSYRKLDVEVVYMIVHLKRLNEY